MRRLLQHSLAAGAVFGCLVALAALSLTPGLAEEPAKDLLKSLPKVDKNELKSYTETVTAFNPVDKAELKASFEMVPIPGGVFLMGSPTTEKDRKDDEGPQHPVQVAPFWMGKCEVTWEEYDLYWKAVDEIKNDKDAPKDKDNPKDKGDAVTRPTPPYADETFGHGREGRPVLCVTHHAAMEYCRWLSQKTGKTYRLPTEAEWEWACRAGTTTAYSFGNDPKDLGDYAWYEENSEELTHPVGMKKPNPWGLYDMHGNVGEWCLDMYKPDYKEFPVDKITLRPVFVPTADRFGHVARGGSWMDKADRLRSAARRASDKKWIKRDPQRPQSIWWLTDAEFVGFRIVRPLQEQENLKGLKSKVTRDSN